MREVIAVVGQEIPLGRYGEHLATCVSFDISEWVNTYGDGVVQLIHQRNGDSAPYPCVVEQDGSTVTWDITNADTAVSGRGRAELQYFVGDTLVKSEVYATTTERALSPASETPPAPHEAWVDKVLEAAANVAECETGAQQALAGVQDAIDNIPDGATPIINDLTTGGKTMALSAEMGKQLAQGVEQNAAACQELAEEMALSQPRVYKDSAVAWNVCRIPGDGEFWIATHVITEDDGLPTDNTVPPYEFAKTPLRYRPAPYPVTGGCCVTATCDRRGQYVSNVNGIFGDATVAFSYRVFDPEGTDAIKYTARFIMAGPVAVPPSAPTKAYNKTVGDEIVEIAQSYVDAQLAGRKFAYGKNFFYIGDASKVPINNSDGAGMMECDTYVGLVLRGVRYEDSPYANETPGFVMSYDDMMANCAYSGSSWCGALRERLAGEEPNNVYGRDIRFAADVAWLGWLTKGQVFSDIANAKPGDVCVWKKPGTSKYFDNVSHIAIFGKDGYIYEVTGTVDSGGKILHKIALAEKRTPDYFARLY